MTLSLGRKCLEIKYWFTWLLECDKNTKYFNVTNLRQRASNRILHLDNMRDRTKKEEEISIEMCNNLASLLTTENKINNHD